MPENAKVFIFDDETEKHKEYREILEKSGHSVVATASDYESALKIIPHLKELGVQVVVLDMRMNPDNDKSIEGRIILRKIRDLFTNDIKSVGMSGSKFPETDYDLGKSNRARLGEVVTQL